jgi:hypothetical protein
MLKGKESMNKLPKLPIGIQSFERIRREGYLYVDKTQHLVDLIDNGSVYFLSRPRRFGKSLMLSTFEALFAGKKQLFQGLYAAEFFDRPEYRIHPVIHLDMSDLTTNMGPDGLRASLLERIRDSARQLGVNIEITMPGDAFSRLMSGTAEKYGTPVVLLIDEYDKPVLDALFDAEKINAAREILKDFYTRIKAADRYLRFVFMTGISKFSKMGVFSALNSLKDISMTGKYATMLGYTEKELLTNFEDYIVKTADTTGKSREELIMQIRDYYDGFSFDGESRLYNPFSTLNFFSEQKFLNFWFETGTPSFIARYMKDRHFTVEQFRGIDVSLNFASAPGEIENATVVSFLYQSGYLSLRPGHILDYSLDYPNREVLVAMSSLLTANILGDSDAAEASISGLKNALINDNASVVVAEFNRLLAKIPYDDYTASIKENFEIRNPEVNFGEWLYRSTLLSYLYGAELRVEAELHGHRGRADMVVEFRGRVWVMELKVAKKGENAGKLADAALAQILEMGYADPFKNAVLLGVAIDNARRSITEFRMGYKGERNENSDLKK